jgi:tetratricopeptide (TPR) repeat protein/predicted Ser/Thr protein kinase
MQPKSDSLWQSFSQSLSTGGVTIFVNHSTESLLRIETIFNEALAARDDARSELIEARCNRDAALMAEVHSLLKACGAEELAMASRRPEPATRPGDLPDRRRIGPYEVDRLLGRGGMGAVYLAHRADGQFEQQVAIKLVDLPLATEVFRERFRQERQILAGLQHPLIARLLDGGVTGEGDLYLAMEYVDGVPIDRFCEEKKLAVPQRLALFKSVCEAVQFAHQNLVVHRDLKPDNILVAEDGRPRLLDFGTAKLLSPSVKVAGGDLTRQGYQSFTPQYASPEQVLGNPITTASDAYSLGVLLYLLLTGTPPYELKDFSTAEMVRVICHEPPRRPTVAVGSNRRLDADLESILQKALRKEPQERYLTAEQFASDVQAYLDGQPVGARRGTLRYRASKFARRNWLGLAGAGLLAATLVAGLAGILWQARVANAERHKAEARSADLRQLSNSLLSELDEAIKQLPGSTGVQKLLVTRVLEHLDRMAKDAQGDRLTQLDLVDAYTRLGNIQGNGYDQNLGDPAGGLASLGKALAIAGHLATSAPHDRDATRALASVEQSRSEVLWGIGNTKEAVTAMQAAVKSFDTLIADPHTAPALIGDAAGAYANLGDELGQPGTPSLGNLADALSAYRKAINLDYRALSIDPNFLRCKRGLAIMQMKVGNVELETDPAQALTDFQIALQRADALPVAEQSSLAALRLRAMLLRKEANSHKELGQYAEAFSLYTQVVQMEQHFVAADPQDLRALVDLEVILADEASSYEDEANPALVGISGDRHRNLLAAEGLLGKVAAIMEKMLKQDPANMNWRALLANVQVRMGTIRELVHSQGDAKALSRKGLAVLKDLAKKTQVPPMILEQAVGAILRVEPASLRSPQLAVAWAERGVALSHRQTPAWLLSLAQAYRADVQIERGRATAKEGLALLPVLQPGATKPRIRKLLEMEARAGG